MSGNGTFHCNIVQMVYRIVLSWTLLIHGCPVDILTGISIPTKDGISRFSKKNILNIEHCKSELCIDF
jgi:hypothetical protein